jgi:hypothetical protein
VPVIWLIVGSLAILFAFIVILVVFLAQRTGKLSFPWVRRNAEMSRDEIIRFSELSDVVGSESIAKMIPDNYDVNSLSPLYKDTKQK